MPLTQYESHKSKMTENLEKMVDGTLAYEIFWENTTEPPVHEGTAPEVLQDIIHAINQIQETYLEPGIPAYRQRIAILDKMNNDETISEEEHTLMTQVPMLAKDPEIANYSRIEKEKDSAPVAQPSF